MKYKEEALTKFIGKFLLCNTLLLAVLYIGLLFENIWFIWFCIGVFLITGTYTIIVGNSNRFKR